MLKLFEMFSGYGGASWGLLKAKIPFECVGISEIDKFAIQCFNQNFPNVKNFGDCSKINPEELPDFDLLIGGFPCQDVSIAGNRNLSQGRTNLYEEILRIANIKKPKLMLLENVKGLLSMEVNERKLDLKIVNDLKKIGYDVCWKVLNSKDYGIPQNRERVWFVCKFGGWDFMEFQFPEKEELKIFVKDILEKEVDKKYFLSEKSIKRLLNKGESYHSEVNPKISSQQYKIARGMDLICKDVEGNEIKNIPEIAEGDRIYGVEGIVPTIKNTIKISLTEKTRDVGKAIDVATQISNKEGKPVQLDLYHLQHGQIRPLSTYIPQNLDEHRCLQAGEPKEVLIFPCLCGMEGGQRGERGLWNRTNMIRRLTPKECFRLMGFLNDEINLVGISDSQCYKLAGNGWDVNLVSKIFKKMFRNS